MSIDDTISTGIRGQLAVAGASLVGLQPESDNLEASSRVVRPSQFATETPTSRAHGEAGSYMILQCESNEEHRACSGSPVLGRCQECVLGDVRR